MDLKQLAYFVEVVERGSFSKAAVSLNLAQPSLSRQIAALETELGHRLLERTGRGVNITEAGLALLSHAKVMLNAAEEAKFQIKEMRNEPSGKVVVGLPLRVSMGLCVPLIQRFREQWPNALITVVEGLSLSLREALIHGRIDLALLFDPAPTPLLKYETLMREKLMLVAPASVPLPKQVSLHMLKDFPMVLPSSPNPIRNLIDAFLLPKKIDLKIVAEVGAVHSALALVETAMACSILPESALNLRANHPKVSWAPIGPPAMWNQLILAIPAARPMNRLTTETSKLLRALDFRNSCAPSSPSRGSEAPQMHL
ncbi:LysR family transcriptional regulator [Limnohabitans sp. DCL3]|jgi:LysR family nitrogen assimilation transcriptional regulator|uniref:LysR family transcriptional regulator n=1 Tax=Limnohabitans sp. DCL3 TaxID=3374103 RepID=UPI003A844717